MKRICLGKIAGAHGVKGLVKIKPYGEDTNLLNGVLYISETDDKTLNVTLKNPSGKYILAEISGLQNREDAEKLKGTELYLNRDELPDLEEENTFYQTDLIGLKAVDEHGKTIGTVITVENFGAGDLLEIQPSGGGQSYYVPVSKQYIPDIDLSERKLTVIYTLE